MTTKKILVTGGTGMVGQAFASYPNCILVGSGDCDLKSYEDTVRLLCRHQPDVIIHLAAKVGGVQGNMKDQDGFFHDNLAINTNVLRAAHVCNVDMVVSMLSTCIFPENPRRGMPYDENDLHDGEPHGSNFGYAYAKRMLEVQSRIYREQHGRKYVCVIPNNIFGPHDNFDLENGHVLPAIIRKIYEAKLTKEQPVFWGNGRSLRQFTYSKDVAKAILTVVDRVDHVCKANKLNGRRLYKNYTLVNIGASQEYSISSVVNKICNIFEYDKWQVKWDEDKPNGIFRKPSDNTNFMNLFVDASVQEESQFYTDFDLALKETCNWFADNYPKVRGVKI